MNKLLIIIIVASIFGFKANSQESKFLVGGTIGFGYSNSKSLETMTMEGDTKTVIFSASPIFGYSFTKNIMTGIALDYILNNTYYDGKTYDYQKQSNNLISPFIRYYLNFPLFFHGQVNIGNCTTKTKGELYVSTIVDPISLDYETKHSVFGAGLGLGYDIKLSDQIILEPMIRYVFNSYKDKNDSNDYKNSDLLFNIGLIYRF